MGNRGKLGVIGGLGPMATAYFYQLVTEMTAAEKDQDHIDIDIASRPGIPDRTAFILGESDADPVPGIVAAGKFLAAAGASCLAIPCMTAHFFHDRIQAELPVPVIHAIAETARYLKEAGAKRCGVMATDGSVTSGVFGKALSAEGLEVIYPEAEEQKAVMSIIYDDVKSGNPVDFDSFMDVSNSLFASGADAIILGCTELSVVKRDFRLGPGYIDCMEVLAAAAIERCGGRVKSGRQILKPRRKGRKADGA